VQEMGIKMEGKEKTKIKRVKEMNQGNNVCEG
jgi:hypothetical protein